MKLRHFALGFLWPFIIAGFVTGFIYQGLCVGWLACTEQWERWMEEDSE